MAKTSTTTKADTKKSRKATPASDPEMPRTATKAKKGTRGDGGKKKKGMRPRSTSFSWAII